MLRDVRLKNVFTSLYTHFHKCFSFPLFSIFPFRHPASNACSSRHTKPRHSYRVAQPTDLPSLTENHLSESGHTHLLTAQQKTKTSPQMPKIFPSQPCFSPPVRLHALPPSTFTKKNSHPVPAPIPEKGKQSGALGTNFHPHNHERPSAPCHKRPAGMATTGEWRGGVCWWR